MLTVDGCELSIPRDYHFAGVGALRRRRVAPLRLSYVLLRQCEPIGRKIAGDQKTPADLREWRIIARRPLAHSNECTVPLRGRT
jgi:hypothetical protein